MKETPISVFVAYSREDEKYKEKLLQHLSLLKRKEVINTWHDSLIIPGATWDEEVRSNLENSKIIILLISIDFLSSDYCYEQEMSRAIARHESKKSIVIPVIVRPCDWKESPIGHIQVLPKDGIPLISPVWGHEDEGFLDVVTRLKTLIARISENKNTRSIPQENFELNEILGKEEEERMDRSILHDLNKYLLKSRQLEDVVLTLKSTNRELNQNNNKNKELIQKLENNAQKIKNEKSSIGVLMTKSLNFDKMILEVNRILEQVKVAYEEVEKLEKLTKEASKIEILDIKGGNQAYVLDSILLKVKNNFKKIQQKMNDLLKMN